MTTLSLQIASLGSALAVIAAVVGGCASNETNPPAPRTNLGYVDFYSPTTNALSWEVSDATAAGGQFKTVFSDLKPPANGVVRLAFAPGHHRLRVTFLNRVITKPAEVEVDVYDGKVTPVRVVFIEAGTTLVKTKEINRGGGTVRGPYGGRTRIGSDETIRYDISTTADPPAVYQAKERMPYAR
jgi:hypothetical protein